MFNVKYDSLFLKEEACSFGDYSCWLLSGTYVFDNVEQPDLSFGRIGMTGLLQAQISLKCPKMSKQKIQNILLKLAKQNHLSCIDLMLNKNAQAISGDCICFEPGKRRDDSPFWDLWPKFIFCSGLLNDSFFLSLLKEEQV